MRQVNFCEFQNSHNSAPFLKKRAGKKLQGAFPEEATNQSNGAAASGGASDISGWLRQIGIAEDDVDSVLLHFQKPEYGVKTLCELFALEEDDVDEILCSLPLAKKRLIKTRLKANT